MANSKLTLVNDSWVEKAPPISKQQILALREAKALIGKKFPFTIFSDGSWEIDSTNLEPSDLDKIKQHMKTKGLA